MTSLSDISKKFDESVLTEIIRKGGGTKYTSYTFGTGSNKGDSYLSKVFRLTVHGINETTGNNVNVHLIVKALPDNTARRKFFHSVEFFRNEISFYTKVIPAWEEFQRKRQPKKPFTEYPACYAYLCDGENDYIALEDVSVSGYVTLKRQDYLSLEDCQLIMGTLGRFHGMSLVFRDLEPEGFDRCVQSVQETYYMENNRDWYIEFMRLACSVVKDAIKKLYEGTMYYDIANAFLQDHLYDDLIALVNTKSRFSVICHGDCWIPNFLISYTPNGNAKALKMIDFQLTRYASAALDISFFLYSCTSQSIREMHFDSLLQTYYNSAMDLITDMGGDSNKLLSWSSLRNEFQKFGRFGCGMAIESLPMSLLDDDEVANLDEIQESTQLNDVWNIKCFKDPAKLKRIADIFKHAIDLHCIE